MKPSINYTNIVVVFILFLFITSCAKKEVVPLIDVSGLSIVNASPSLENLDVYVDNTKVTNTGSVFTFGGKIDYLTAYSGRDRKSVV